MTDELTVIQHVLGIDEEAALVVLELCDMLEREDLIASHGYPKDTPSGRNIGVLLGDPEYRARLIMLAEAEDADEQLLQALAKL